MESWERPGPAQGRTVRPCPLCLATRPVHFHRDARRDYFRCTNCRLVFVPPEQFCSAGEEKAHYDWHTNHPADPRYRQFLSRLFTPLKARLRPGDRGLDFGSGPGPTLSVMFQEAGHRMALYDPFYAPDDAVLDERYDFITASEVAEHLHKPRQELDRLWAILKPGGWLGVMTKRVSTATAFARWHYKDDPTHVTFFALETFAWLAERWQAELSVNGPDVVLMRKPDAAEAREPLTRVEPEG